MDEVSLGYALRLLHWLSTLGSVFACRAENARVRIAVSLTWCLCRGGCNLNHLLWLACHFLFEQIAQVALVLDCT